MSQGYILTGGAWGTRGYGSNGQISASATDIRPLAAMQVHNDGATIRWLHIFAGASSLPANGSVPTISYELPLGDNMSPILPVALRLTAVGWWAISSTGNTLTSDGSALVAFHPVFAP